MNIYYPVGSAVKSFLKILQKYLSNLLRNTNRHVPRFDGINDILNEISWISTRFILFFIGNILS